MRIRILEIGYKPSIYRNNVTQKHTHVPSCEPPTETWTAFSGGIIISTASTLMNSFVDSFLQYPPHSLENFLHISVAQMYPSDERSLTPSRRITSTASARVGSGEVDDGVGDIPLFGDEVTVHTDSLLI